MDQESAALIRSAAESLEEAVVLLRGVLPEREESPPSGDQTLNA